MTYDRETIEGMRPMERPTVRCNVMSRYTDLDGHSDKRLVAHVGRIIVDGNNPWVEVWAAGRSIAERFSWGLVCQVINNRFESPIEFSTIAEYEV